MVDILLIKFLKYLIDCNLLFPILNMIIMFIGFELEISQHYLL